MKALIRSLCASWLICSVQICSVGAAEPSGAKGLFFSQLERPNESINTGIQYWIELHRGGSTTRVNNKTAFHSGDRIRFHVKPNIDGYAYILLRSGSRGEQAVLFPDPEKKEENKLLRGKDYVLPGDGELKFDQNPGIEKLSLLLSRAPIDTTAYVSPNAESPTRLVATIASGSKDLIPSQILVSYVQPSTLPKVSSAHTDNEAVGGQIAKKTSTKSQTLTKDVAIKHHHHVVSSGDSNIASDKTSIESGITTVVYKDPSGVLAVDVSLEHI
jgi:hypothetical protein